MFHVYIDTLKGRHFEQADNYNQLLAAVRQADYIKEALPKQVHTSVWCAGKCFYSTDSTVVVNGIQL